MASPYTSARSGLWDASDVDTWGQGLNQYPQTANDVVTISTGHTVTYNKVSTTEMGAITVNGIFKASRLMSTKITLGNVDIAVAATGEMDWGKTGDLISSSYTAELLWNTTSDNGKGITVASGGKFYCLDNPAYYGSLDYSLLQANWTTGTSFYVTDNVVGKWATGHELTVYKNPTLYSTWISDTALVSISTVSWDGVKSTITINEAFPTGTFYAGGRVEHVSRNVQFSKLGASKAISNVNTNRPRMTMINTITNPYCETGGKWVGWYSISITYGTISTAVISNGVGSYSIGNGVIFSGKVYSCTYGLNQVTSTLGGALYACANGAGYICNGCLVTAVMYGSAAAMAYMQACITTGNIHGNSTVYNRSQGCLDLGYMYANGMLYNNSTGMRRIGSFGYNSSGTRITNTTESGAYTSVWCRNTSTQATPTLNRNYTAYNCNLYMSDYNGVVGAHYRFATFSDVIKNTGTLRSGGQSSSIEVVPQSYMSATWKDRIPGEADWLEHNVPATTQTRTVYVRGEGWSGNFPTNTELYLEAEYLNSAVTLATTTVKSTQVLSDNVTWTALTVTFTPAQAGPVRYRIWMGKYASSCKVYIDAGLYLNSLSRPCRWRDGEPMINMDYSEWTKLTVIGVPA